MVYVALLRGINVGGNNKISMKELTIALSELGFKNIKTYINSGNVIFEDKRDPEELVKIIEQSIKDSFGLQVPVILREKENIGEICNKTPQDWTNDSVQKTDVMFLWDEIDTDDIMKNFTINPEIEKVSILPGALVWNIAREHVTRGSGIKIISSDAYSFITIRNINTVRKLYNLMEGL